ncbi:annexin A6 [Aspergillus brasiliensis]|uniref:Annexin n=1 Tax=Aspergillus brasiliensis TaxID=319629 RepID=A0A9W6DQP9_9EURO|nr:annexin A6 [Aspergillus brasiliensis]GKZ48562.1 annexin A6 [Aspergillus brasiliensis]
MSYQQPYGQGPPQGYNQYPPQGQYPPPQGQYGQQQQRPQYPPQGPGPYQQGPGSYQPPQQHGAYPAQMAGHHQSQPPYPPQQQHQPHGASPYPPPMSGQHQQPGPYPSYPPPQQGMGYPQQGPPFQQGYPQGHPPQPGYPNPQQQQQYQSFPPGQQPPMAPPGAGGPYPNYPPQQGPMPSRPSPGYDPTFVPMGTASNEAEALRKAMKGFGTDEKALIRVLTSTSDPNRMALIRHTYEKMHNRNLIKDLKSETSGSFETILVSLATGPLESDITYLHNAMSGLGTNEKGLNDVLLGRSNADLAAIQRAYRDKYHKSLLDDIKGELSGKTERFFEMLLHARRPERGTPFDPRGVETDVRELHRATAGKVGTDEVAVFGIFMNSSDERLNVLAGEFERMYHVPLEKVIKDEFTGHLEDALVMMLRVARDPISFHAGVVKECFFGSNGVNEKRLVYWAVRLHWDPDYFARVKGAMGGSLAGLVRNYVSGGDFEDALMAVCSH